MAVSQETPSSAKIIAEILEQHLGYYIQTENNRLDILHAEKANYQVVVVDQNTISVYRVEGENIVIVATVGSSLVVLDPDLSDISQLLKLVLDMAIMSKLQELPDTPEPVVIQRVIQTELNRRT